MKCFYISGICTETAEEHKWGLRDSVLTDELRASSLMEVKFAALYHCRPHQLTDPKQETSMASNALPSKVALCILSLSLETFWCIHLPPWAVGMSRTRNDSETGYISNFELKCKCPHPSLSASGRDKYTEATIFPTGTLASGFPKLRSKLCLLITLLEGLWAEGSWVRLGEWICGSEGK